MRLYTHPDCVAHEVPDGHPERPDRLRALLGELRRAPVYSQLDEQPAPPASDQQLAAAHHPQLLSLLNDLAPAAGLVAVDADTAMGPHSLSAARHAAGALVDAVDSVLQGAARSAFCAVRPPGHHAEANGAMGFCLYNSVAVGAKAALASAQHSVERVAILDFDVHHGNGTVDIFKDTPEVLVCSSFQHPFYPFRYADLDRAHVVNTPLPAGTGSDAFRNAIEASWIPALRRHQPQLILVSAGFDAHAADPLAQLQLRTEDYTWITQMIVDEANRTGAAGVVATLEGGYDLDALAASAVAHITALAELA